MIPTRSALAISLVVLVASACTSQQAAPTNASTSGASDARAYSVDTEPDACTHGADCAFRIRLAALGNYHVNPDYPHRFLSGIDAGLEFTGDRAFALEGEKRGTLTVHYRTESAGAKKIAGTFKLSVCNPDQCKIEEAPIAFDVAVQ